MDPIQRLGWWFGVIFVPWIFLAICILAGVAFGTAKHGSVLFDLAYLMFLYPFASVPLLWALGGSWPRKFVLSAIYVLGCYALPVLVLILALGLIWKDGWCL